MGSAADPANDETPRKASEWLVALKDDPANGELRSQFERWLAASPAHARDWAEMSRTLDVMGRTQPVHRQEWQAFATERKADRISTGNVAGGFQNKAGAGSTGAASRNRHSGRTARRRWVQGLMAVAACLALVFGPDFVLRMRADHATGTAQQQEVRLADGSTIRLAPKSAIDVAYGSDARRVRLLKGEAFFEVKHDAGHPFTVEAQSVEIKDIGTAFDVRIGPVGTEVAVRQGLVEVNAAEGAPIVSERLEPGDWMRVAPGGKVARGRIAADEVASWTQGQLIAKSRPVAEVVDALRPYFSGLIILRGGDLADQPLTGVYNLADPLDALYAVARAQGATIHRISPWILVVSGR